MQTQTSFPGWLTKSLSEGKEALTTDELVQRMKLNTVCSSARCPNRDECYSKKTVTFLILGGRCTRKCGFCSVDHGTPAVADPDEGARIAEAASALGLRHIVITSVTRDDLEDEGAGHFALTVRAIKRKLPEAAVEVLTPDFRRTQDEAVRLLGELPIEVFSHNIEVVERIHRVLRPGGSYEKSLGLLEGMSRALSGGVIKSGAMVGLGETKNEVINMMKDLYFHGCRTLTIGQYLQSTPRGVKVERFVTPEEFEEYRKIGYNIGFLAVESAPFVRSSYHAAASLGKAREAEKERLILNGDSSCRKQIG